MAFRDYSVKIEKQINRLVPYYMRGRKMLLFLHSISSPLEFFNDEDTGYNTWAHRKLLDLSMTAQKPRLVWYLNNVVVPDNEIELRAGQTIDIHEEPTSSTILYFKSEIRDQTTAPLFYPQAIPTVTRLKTDAADSALLNIVTRRKTELGSVGGRFVISVPYDGNSYSAVSKSISSAIARFIPVGITFRIVFT